MSRAKRNITNRQLLLPLGAIILLVTVALLLIKFLVVQPHSTSQRASIRIGMTIPDFSLTEIKGRKVQFSQLSGKIFLLNFWATWCDSCMEEMPSIVKLEEMYKSRGFKVIAVNLDEKPELATPKAIQEFKIPFEIFHDPSGKLADLFDVHAIPFTAVVNKERNVLYLKDGSQNWTSPQVLSMIEGWLSK